MVLPHKNSPDEVICFLDWVFQGIAKHSKLVLILHVFLTVKSDNKIKTLMTTMWRTVLPYVSCRLQSCYSRWL